LNFTYVFLLENEAKYAQNRSTLNNRIQRTKTLTERCPNKKGLSVVKLYAVRKTDNPLSYDDLTAIGHNVFAPPKGFEHKVPAQDRGDIRHSIILNWHD